MLVDVGLVVGVGAVSVAIGVVLVDVELVSGHVPLMSVVVGWCWLRLVWFQFRSSWC